MDMQTVYQFISKKDLPNHFPTICGEADAEFQTEPPTVVWFRYQKYEDQQVEAILAQAREWQVKVHYVEDWDPEFYPGGKRIEEDYFAELESREILVADGMYAGVMHYSIDHSDQYHLRCVLTSDYRGEPMFYQEMTWYGSSDLDVRYHRKCYLVKK